MLSYAVLCLPKILALNLNTPNTFRKYSELFASIVFSLTLWVL